MRVMVLVKASRDSEAGKLPSRELLSKMGSFNKELAEAGVLLAAEGLHPSSRGMRVRFSAGAPSLFDGPFAEIRELVAGFWLWQVQSMEEALGWIKRAPFTSVTDVEIRPLMEAADFGTRITPEMLEEEERLREQMEQKRAS
jgi:hypothetical protein